MVTNLNISSHYPNIFVICTITYAHTLSHYYYYTRSTLQVTIINLISLTDLCHRQATYLNN